MSRTASNNTTIQSRHITTGPRIPSSPHTKQPSRESNLRQSYQATEYKLEEPPKSPAADPSSSSSSSSDSESEKAPNRVKHPFKRAGRFSSARTPSRPIEDSNSLRNEDEEDEDDETPAFLPISRSKRPDTTPFADPSATLRLAPSRPATQRRQLTTPNPSTQPTHSSGSSASSAPIAQPAPASQPDGRPTMNRPTTTGPLSPHRAAELAKLSPRRRAAAGKDGSDGTPSMGSSFSDLDGAPLPSR
jgi:hypothetical protein